MSLDNIVAAVEGAREGPRPQSVDIPATRRQLSSQSFWNHMNFFQEEHCACFFEDNL